MTEDTAFDAAVAAHRQALTAYIASATQMAATRWNAARDVGKWSPAEITEHLRLSYVPAIAELAGQGGFRMRTPRWQQLLLRLWYLPRILRRGRMPTGVPAVREVRPGNGPFDQHALLLALQAAGEQFLDALGAARSRPSQRVTHPFLGKLTLAEGLGLSTAHLRHHHQQLDGAAGTGPV